MRSALPALVVAVCLATLPGCSQRNAAASPSAGKKVIVLGMDGLDPRLLDRWMAEGKLPHFEELARRGDYRRLATTTPPQSPVAWSSLITGMDPGGTGIFDFIHRDPSTMEPYLSTSRVEAPKHVVKLGSWVIPLSSGHTLLLRRGKAFWEFLDAHGIPATVYHMPANFPPVESKARTLAGMGTPDLLGTYGTFSFYTDDLFRSPGAVDGGRVYAVQVENNRVRAQLQGLYNTLRKGEPPVLVDFTADIDPIEPVAKISIQDQEFILKEGEWSDWVRIEFPVLPVLKSIPGICRFYLKQAHPRFELYVSPINLDPREPALPLSTPASYSRELADEIGPYYTQGIAEDTKALSARVFDDADFLAQARLVMQEHLRAFEAEFPRFRSGLFFFYFSSTDPMSHMFWRAMDPKHPAYTPEAAAVASQALEQTYVEMDRILGEVMARDGDQATIIVLSDHGFAPYYRSFNLNTWLAQNGYLALREGQSTSGEYLGNIDWSRTRAYGLGLNGLYLNLAGREKQGIVHRGAEADALLAELRSKLLAVKDPATGQPAISRVDLSSEVYSGAYVAQAPDLLVGYNYGFRAGWGTVLGGVAQDVFEDNAEPWSGDHCMDPRLVPGVLLSNRKILNESPSLVDIAPTILAEFGIERPPEMKGRSVFAADSGR